MEQFAEQITVSLIQELPDQSKSYTPKELLSAGIPYFVVETLRDTIASTIESGMKLPDSDWIQTDANEVKTAWQSFVGLTKEHIKVPSAKLPQLLQNAVEQCLKLMIRPRQSVPEYIFKTPTDIDFETAKERVFTLEVSQQLGLALVRYMEKKQKNVLSFEEARDLIKKIDEKMVENYHPLNWAQVLKPVFELAGPAVDSQLLRKFFEDKNKRKIARKFELLDKKVSESEFIEILSSADLLDVEGYEDEQQQLFVQSKEVDIPKKPEKDEYENEELEQEPEAEEEENSLVSNEEEPESEEAKIEPEIVEEEPESEEAEIEAEIVEESAEHQEEEEKNLADLFAEIREAGSDEETLSDIELEHEEPELSLREENDDSDTEEEIPLLNKFMFDEGDTEESIEAIDEDEKENDLHEKEPASIYEEMNLVRENESEQQKVREMISEDSAEDEDAGEEPDELDQEESFEELSYKIEKEKESSDLAEEEPAQFEKSPEESDEKSDEDEDLPMWRSFLERDDIETESGYEYEEEITENEPEEEDEADSEIEDDEGFIEEPIYDLTTTEPDPEEKLEEVSKWLDDEKGRFVQEIFGNSEIAYEQALFEIMDFDDWKSASHYLEREVFARNRVEVYDEAAVDFTDRLHSYFMEHKS